jgi:hypothetical protein
MRALTVVYSPRGYKLSYDLRGLEIPYSIDRVPDRTAPPVSKTSLRLSREPLSLYWEFVKPDIPTVHWSISVARAGETGPITVNGPTQAAAASRCNIEFGSSAAPVRGPKGSFGPEATQTEQNIGGATFLDGEASVRWDMRAFFAR